jgi:hypothetical protein
MSQIFSQKMVSLCVYLPFSPTLLLVLQAVLHDLFVKSTVHTNSVPINSYLHYLWAEIPYLKGICTVAFFGPI